jgi:hypothetical protein
MAPRTRRDTAHALDTKAIAGVDKYLVNAASVAIRGTDYAPTDLKVLLQAEIDADKALDEARAEVRQLMAAAAEARAKAAGIRRGLRTYVLATSGPQAVQMLDDFGFSKSASVPTVDAKAKAVAKAKATRDAHQGSTPTPANAEPSAPPAKPTV